MPAENQSRHSPPTTTTEERRLVFCSSDLSRLAHLQDEAARYGYRTVCATRTAMARELIAAEPAAAVILDLLLGDGDGISLACELRKIYPWLPVTVLTTETRNTSAHADPVNTWISSASRQARLIFALKHALRRWEGEPPRILYLDAGDHSAGLLRATLPETVCLFRARNPLEARIAMAVREFDFAIVNAEQPLYDGNDCRALSGRPLAINNGDASTLLSTLIENLRTPARTTHSSAIC